MEWTKETVVALRSRLRMTQKEFADEIGVARQTVSAWEQGLGEIRPLNAAALSRLAGKPADVQQPDDFQRGVQYACEMFAATLATLLQEHGAAARDEALRKKAINVTHNERAADPAASAEQSPRRRRA